MQYYQLVSWNLRKKFVITCFVKLSGIIVFTIFNPSPCLLGYFIDSSHLHMFCLTGI